MKSSTPGAHPSIRNISIKILFIPLMENDETP
jgi:hypothetical protein